MADTLSIIDPSHYSTMDIVEAIDSEKILADRMATYVERWTAHDPPMAAIYDQQNEEFDPHKIVQETNVIYERTLRNRINQVARACTLAFATGRDLDTIASRYPGGVPRVASEIYDFATALYPERKAKDDRYRQRIWQSPFKLARGSTGFSYRFDAMTVTDARDVSVSVERSTEQVSSVVTLMMNRYDSPAPTKAEILQAFKALDVPDIVQNTDVLAVRPCTVIDRHYTFNVYFRPYVDQDAIVAAIEKDAKVKFEETFFYLGRDVGRQEVEGICDLPGVHHVEIDGFEGEVFTVPHTHCARTSFNVVPKGTVQKRGVT